MPYKLSPSSLKLFGECKRCFWLHHNKGIRRPDTIFPSLPGGMDRILKHHFDVFRKKQQLPPELEEMNGSVTLFDNVELLNVWRANLRGIRWEDKKGNLLRGAVDEILQKGKKLIVLDYKTRGYPLKDNTAEFYQDQLNIYNFLLRKNGYETENYGYLLFYYPNKVLPNGDISFHAELVKMGTSPKDAEKLFTDAINVLEGKEPKSDEECGFCAWADKV